MNPEDVANVMDEIGRRVGPLGEQTAEILVRGTFAESLVWAIGGAFLLLIAIGMVGLIIYGIRENSGDMVGVGLFGAVGAAVVGLPILLVNMVGVIAPDYVAIKHILEAIAGTR